MSGSSTQELDGRRTIARHHMALLMEATAAALVAGCLIEGLHFVERAAGDLQAAFALALFPFCAGLVLLFHHVNQVLDLDCPRCDEAFHGDGIDAASVPFRRRCAHCGLPASTRLPAGVPEDEAGSGSW